MGSGGGGRAGGKRSFSPFMLFYTCSHVEIQTRSRPSNDFSFPANQRIIMTKHGYSSLESMYNTLKVLCLIQSFLRICLLSSLSAVGPGPPINIHKTNISKESSRAGRLHPLLCSHPSSPPPPPDYRAFHLPTLTHITSDGENRRETKKQ